MYVAFRWSLYFSSEIARILLTCFSIFFPSIKVFRKTAHLPPSTKEFLSGERCVTSWKTAAKETTLHITLFITLPHIFKVCKGWHVIKWQDSTLEFPRRFKKTCRWTATKLVVQLPFKLTLRLSELSLSTTKTVLSAQVKFELWEIIRKLRPVYFLLRVSREATAKSNQNLSRLVCTLRLLQKRYACFVRSPLLLFFYLNRE